MLAVRARALLDGRLAPSIDDVLDLAEPVIKHRMALTFTARAEGESIEAVVGSLTSRIGGGAASRRLGSIGAARRATIISMCASWNGRPRTRCGSGPTARRR